MESIMNIVLLDKHQLFREGVKQVLETKQDFRIIVSSDDYSVLQSALEVYTVDVVLLETLMFMEHQQDIAALIEETQTKVIVIGGKGEESFVTNAIKAGVHGYLLKEMDIYSFVDAINLVKEGDFYIHPAASNELIKEYLQLLQGENEVRMPLHLFTKRECEILQLLAEGKSNRKMAETLQISEKTVKNHVSNLFKKLNVNDRTTAVITAIRNHWVHV